jgi:hypothetical protein
MTARSAIGASDISRHTLRHWIAVILWAGAVFVATLLGLPKSLHGGVADAQPASLMQSYR